MTMLCAAATALLLFQSAGAKPPAPKPAPAKPAAAAAKPAATDLAVTVTYKGKQGAVDANHQILMWLFTDPNINANSKPVATLSTAKNGDTLVFTGVPAAPLYIFAAYDSKGGYDGRSSAPPPGIPTALYSKTAKGPATAVKAGDPTVKLTIDDSRPWK
jgi:hypothetical protein